MNRNYYNWFNKIINVIIEIFFVGALLSTLYVFTYLFNGTVRTFIFIGITLIFATFVFLLRNKIKQLIQLLIKKIASLDVKTMLIIIVLTMIILKIVATLFFYFNPAVGDDSDISIYASMADYIVENGQIQKYQISHLTGVALHLALMKVLSIPYHIGIFILFLIGTIVNFFSFKRLIGKEKTFLLIMIYALMPSTVFLTFCPTHELFVYFYLSFFVLLINKLIEDLSIKNTITISLLLVIDIVLINFVNPMGKIVYIVLLLTALLTKLAINKKIVIILVLVLSILGSNILTSSLGISEENTLDNTLTILICGSSVDTNGEHVDKYPYHKAIDYLHANKIDYSDESQTMAYKAVLIEQYKYLLTHPIDALKLLTHKFYVEWSGDHYSLEIAHTFNGIGDILYYILLAISAMMYLIVLTLSIVFYEKKEDSVNISNIKLLLLGVVAMLLISLVLNKYSVYMTIYIFFISFYRIKEFNN